MFDPSKMDFEDLRHIYDLVYTNRYYKLINLKLLDTMELLKDHK